MNLTNGRWVMKIKGFTLIEVLTVAFIAGIIGTGVVSLIANSNTVLSDSAVKTFKNSNVQRIFNQISMDVHSGARLVSPGATEDVPAYTLQITDADDNLMYEWTSIRGVISRKVYDEFGAETIQEILIVSSANRPLKPVIGYFVEITGEFYNVQVDIKLTEKDNTGVATLSETDYANKYYCRLDPLE